MLQQRHEAPEPFTFNAERLLAQADTLEARATALRREASELSQEAIDLRVEADRMTRAPLTMLGPPPTPADLQADFLDRVLDVLREAGPLGMRDLSDHLGVTPTRVRGALARLEELGAITKTGIKSGTRYAVADEDDDDAGKLARFESYERAVRDAAIKLDTFEFVDLQAALPDVSAHTLRRWLAVLEGRGLFSSVREGRRKLYAYVPAETGGATNRPRKETPEREAARTAGSGRRANNAVAGTGRAMRSGSSIVDELIREVRPFGITTRKTAHTVVFERDGEVIANSSRTPGASSLKGTRSDLRKAGVPV